jgi:hypothetical protein
MRDECLLEGVQVVAICRQPLDGDDLGILVRDGEGQAAIDASPIEQDGAGAALPVVAALLGAGESEPLAQRIQQRGGRINGQPVGRPVHPQRDLKVHCVYISFGPVGDKSSRRQTLVAKKCEPYPDERACWRSQESVSSRKGPPGRVWSHSSADALRSLCCSSLARFRPLEQIGFLFATQPQIMPQRQYSTN